MAQMWLLWLPKCISATTKASTAERVTRTTAAATSTSSTRSKTIEESRGESCCGGVSVRKILKKLKKQGRMLRAATASRQSSFQCRYDPLSYSLNFDTTGCGSLIDDADYYQFCAFSSRFVGNPSTSSPILVPSASH